MDFNHYFTYQVHSDDDTVKVLSDRAGSLVGKLALKGKKLVGDFRNF